MTQVQMHQFSHNLVEWSRVRQGQSDFILRRNGQRSRPSDDGVGLRPLSVFIFVGIVLVEEEIHCNSEVKVQKI